MQERTKPAQNLDFNESIANASNMNDDTGGACATVDSRSVGTWGTDQGSGNELQQGGIFNCRPAWATIGIAHQRKGVWDSQEIADLLESSTMIVEEMR